MNQKGIVFDLAWFDRHQSKLLWLCNAPIVKYWFRWILRINKDLKFSEDVYRLMPNNYKVCLGTFLEKGKLQIKLRDDFRTNNKFSARLYRAFKPIWWIMHFFDWLCLDDLDYSFGFDTLTVYPDAGTGVTAVDGMVYKTGVDQTFATIISGNGNTVSDTGTTITVQLRASTTTNQYQRLYRGFTLFDTSSLGTDATITSAILALNSIQDTTGTLGASTLDIVSSSPASNGALATTDFGSVGSTVFADIANGSFTTGQYNNLSLNSSGLSNISKTGVSKFGQRIGWDTDGSFTGTWASSSSSTFAFYSADQTGTTQDPKLVITYSTGLELEFNVNPTLTATISLQKETSFLTNPKLSTVFNKLSVAKKIFSENVKLTSTFLKKVSKIFSEGVVLVLTANFFKEIRKTFSANIKLTSTFAKLKLAIKTFSENLKLTATFEKFLKKVFNRTLKLESTQKTLFLRTFNLNLVLTSSIAKLIAFIKEFNVNIKAKTFYQMIKGGFSVGRWTKQEKKTTIWTKKEKQ